MTALKNLISVSYLTPEMLQTALAAATTLDLELVSPEKQQTPYLLLFTPAFVGLLLKNEKKPFYIDFLAGKIHYRSKQVNFKNELLAKAIKLKPSENLTLVDATAGLGRDSFILASLGYKVTMIERSPILFYLLQDAFARASQDPRTHKIISRLNLIQADAVEWLKKTNEIDIIYLDPMFPDKQKSAKAKKDLQILQDIIGKDTDSDTLFTLAKHVATKRVVVKRPRLAPPLKGLEPNYNLIGSSSRFDIYLV